MVLIRLPELKPDADETWDEHVARRRALSAARRATQHLVAALRKSAGPPVRPSDPQGTAAGD